MFKKLVLLSIVITISLLLMPYFVYSHDFWIEKKENRFLILSGHGKDIEGYDPNRVVNWRVFNDRAHKIKLNITKGDKMAFFNCDKNIGLIAVFFDNKYWVKTTEGWKNIGKREAENKGFQVIESGRSYKYAKFINRWNPNFSKPLGDKMEIIPLNNPLNSKNLKIQVLLDKKPLINAPIFLDAEHEERSKTDSGGFAEIQLKNGINIISTTTKVPTSKDPDGDLIYLRASLSFIKE